MRSARIVAPRRFEILKEGRPVLEDGRVLVRLLKAALCGSDLPYFYNTYSESSYPLPPGYPGHECLGVVEDSAAEGFKPGDRVMYYPPFLDAYKEYHCTPPSRLQKLPSGGDANILLMTQILGCVSHGMFRLDSPYGKTVVIMGQGPVGLLFTALARNLGGRRVIAVDRLDYRLEAARKMGADTTLNPDRDDLEGIIGELTGGALADIVIDAYGQNVDVINRCFDLARHNGQVAFFGICLDEKPGLSFNTFFRKELRMVASVGPDLAVDYPYALDMILKGAVDVSPLITHNLPFEQIQEGFMMSCERRDRVIKVVLDF